MKTPTTSHEANDSTRSVVVACFLFVLFVFFALYVLFACACVFVCLLV